MMWIIITLLVGMGVSLLLDFVDMDSLGNRFASMAVRGIVLFVCLCALLNGVVSK